MGPAGENGKTNGTVDHEIPFIPLSYSNDDSFDSAQRLVTSIRPNWAQAGRSTIEFVRFTDGITNTLLKATRRPIVRGENKIEEAEAADGEAVLLRAYGTGTDVLIDRQRETQNHELLWRHGLAPELLARFYNGMMYRFIRGRVAQPADLRLPSIYRAVAVRLAQWHATVPCIPGLTGHSRKNSHVDEKGTGDGSGLKALSDQEFQETIDGVAPGKPSPNMWTVMQKWIFALPTKTEKQRKRQAQLQTDLESLVKDLSQRPGLGKNGLVFAHCDLLSGNVIVLPKSSTTDDETITFIDYEYATPSPAAFDVANHFAEWGGFDCDYTVLPTRAQRRDFVATYVRAYFGHSPEAATDDVEAEVERLMAEVDIFRGVPGFYWGVWALIQATISEIDFDYANYAEVRLGEYYAWRAEADGSRARSGAEMPLRETRWAQEE